jgi:hypothetical protein
MSIDNRSRPDRENKKLLAFYAHETIRRAVKMLAAEEGTTSVALMYEAVGLLLTAHGKNLPPEIETELEAQGRHQNFVSVARLLDLTLRSIRRPASSQIHQAECRPET